MSLYWKTINTTTPYAPALIRKSIIIRRYKHQMVGKTALNSLM